MFRQNITILQDWLCSQGRKPMVLRGARQVGKTWLVRELARVQNRNLIELNFEKTPQFIDIFETNDTKEIIRLLEATISKKIDLKNSILFLDEIQTAPSLLAKLRWFAEDMPELAVIATGSLLDFSLKKHNFHMPVGRISYVYMQPMSFEEFLIATNRATQLEYLQTWQLGQSIPLSLHESISNIVREYLLVGGMPAAVAAWCNNPSFISVAQIQQDLLTTYRDDFTKYESRIDKQRLDEVLRSVPNLLGCKFQYKAVNHSMQSSVIKNALELLITARIVYKVQSCDATGLPLGANVNTKVFKTILLDTGLVSALLKLNTNIEMLKPTFSLNNVGGITEQFVAQELLNMQPFFIEPELYYWTREKAGSSAEIDYIVQHQTHLVPIEVKAGSTGKLRSLHMFMELRKLKFAVRINNDLPNITDINSYKLLSIPFYLVGQLSRLLDGFCHS